MEPKKDLAQLVEALLATVSSVGPSETPFIILDLLETHCPKGLYKARPVVAPPRPRLPNRPARPRGRHSVKLLVGQPWAKGPNASLRDVSATSVCGRESADILASSATPKSGPW